MKVQFRDSERNGMQEHFEVKGYWFFLFFFFFLAKLNIIWSTPSHMLTEATVIQHGGGLWGCCLSYKLLAQKEYVTKVCLMVVSRKDCLHDVRQSGEWWREVAFFLTFFAINSEDLVQPQRETKAEQKEEIHTGPRQHSQVLVLASHKLTI